MLPESKLRDMKVVVRRHILGNPELDPDPKKNRDFNFFFIREVDLVQQTVYQYVLMHTESDAAHDLLKIAQRFRIDLKGKGVETLFRIDPIHGLIVGSSIEAVSRFGTKERPGCFITLVCSRDPGHPLIALQDYVDREDRHRYQEVFQKYNHLLPAKPSIFKRVFGHPESTSSLAGWSYRLISDIVHTLSAHYQMHPQTISIIYENVSESELEHCLLDRKYSTFQTTGTSKFFTSTEELLQ